ncbi:nucleoporin protein Ndc1-Nup-domain-containing protein [Phlyctochytrium arcticum]|nr:nucleoporin protein Ndc1-Nup-domain-containing protein [Phlyctochytrium arcticum]
MAATRLSACITFMGPDLWIALVCYSLSAAVLSFCQVKTQRGGDMFLDYPEGMYNTPRLKEDSAFVMAFGLTLAAGYAVMRRVTERDQLTFPRLQRSLYHRLRDTVQLAFQAAAVNTTKAPAPYVDSNSSVLSLSTIIYAWLNGVMLYACWELVNGIFNVLFTQPLAQEAPLTTLLTGLSSTVDSYSRRQAIFLYERDEPSGWKIVSSECMRILDQLSSAIENEQKKAEDMAKARQIRPVRSANAFALSEPLTRPNHQPDPVVNIYSPTKRATFMDELPERLVDAIYQPGSIARSPKYPSRFAAPADKASEDWDLSKTPYPDLLRPTKKARVKDTDDEASLQCPSKRIHSPGQDDLKRLRKWLLRSEWGTWILGETLERQTTVLFGDLQIHLWAIEVLEHLVVVAPTEDRYGEAGRDLPQVIESLLRCQMALKTRLATPPIKPSSATRLGHQVVFRQPYGLLQVIETSTYRLVTTWYDLLGHLLLNPVYARHFQAFVDFRE